MTLMTMDNRLILRHVAIDRNHQEMFDIIDLVELAMRSGPDKTACISLLNQLCELARKHFAMEETLMSLQPYPQCAQHLGEHDSIINAITEFRGQLEEDVGNLCNEMPGQLRDALSAHITRNDKVLVAVLRCQDYASP
jgi:hemerythrin